MWDKGIHNLPFSFLSHMTFHCWLIWCGIRETILFIKIDLSSVTFVGHSWHCGISRNIYPFWPLLTILSQKTIADHFWQCRIRRTTLFNKLKLSCMVSSLLINTTWNPQIHMKRQVLPHGNHDIQTTICESMIVADMTDMWRQWI